jgi:hypothetical protein
MIVKNILICEDIRAEVGNKLSIMGLFGDSINIEIPDKQPAGMQATIILAALVTLENTDPKNDLRDFKVSITISLENDLLCKMMGEVASQEDSKILHLPVPKFSVQLAESKRLIVKVQLLKKDAVTFESDSVFNVNVTKH